MPDTLEDLARPHRFLRDAGGGQAHLRLMGLSDVHMQIMAYDYFADRPVGAGLALTGRAVAAARAGAGTALLFDNGDSFQGNPMGDLYAAAGGVHPMVAALAALGVDAATPGNHDFNYGLGRLEAILAAAPYPAVATNVVRRLGATALEDEALWPQTLLLRREVVDGEGRAWPLAVGVIGLCPPQILAWDRGLLEGRLEVRDMAEAAAAWVPRLREAGADLVVALAHTGIEARGPHPGQENAALHVAGVAGVDAVIAGHQHRLFPGGDVAAAEGIDPEAGRLAGKPAVMPGLWGRHLGVIDLALERAGDAWRVAEAESAPWPVGEDWAPDPAIEAAVAAAHEATLAHVRQPVGRITAPVRSHFALVADDAAVQLAGRGLIWWARQALADRPEAALPVVGMAAPFKAGGRAGPGFYTDIPAGGLALKDVADLAPYPNTLCALRLSGADLAEWLERSAALFAQVSPGARDAPLIAAGAASYNFDVAVGARYAIDLSRPARYDVEGRLVATGARRISGLEVGGRPLAPDAPVVVVTNSYRAGGGGGFPGVAGAARLVEAEETAAAMLARWFACAGEAGELDPTPVPGWRFAEVPGASAVFDSAPGALERAGPVPDRRIEAVGPAPGGFWRYRVVL